MSPSMIMSPRYRATIENTFVADRTLDPDRFVAGLTRHARFHLGARPVIVGRESIRAVLAETFMAFTSVEHTLKEAFELHDTLIYEATVHYALKSGASIAADYVNVLRYEGDLVADYRIYIDLSVLGA